MANYQKISLGEGRAYLWRDERQGLRRAVITAHGQAVADKTARAMPPNTLAPVLCFYSPHGVSVDDQGLLSYTRGLQAPLERVWANQSYDYHLWKYTNTSKKSRQHNSMGETYALIENLLDSQALVQPTSFANNAVSVALASIRSEDPSGAMQIAHDNIAKAADFPEPTDIITISGQMGGLASVKLSTLLQWLGPRLTSYREIHCVFCRDPANFAGRLFSSALGKS